MSTLPHGSRPETIPPSVGAGRDGWLFFLGNGRLTRRLYSRHLLTIWQLLRWRALILRRVRRAESLGSRYVQFIVPDKLSIYRDRLEAPFPPGAMSPSRRLGLMLPGHVRRRNWVDTYAAHVVERASGDLYYRTDTHWCARGQMLGYRLLCEAFGVDPAPHIVSAAITTRSQVMDIGSKCLPLVEELAEAHAFSRLARRTAENGLVTFREANPNQMAGTCFGSRIVLRNDSPDADPRTVVVFGDSHLFHPMGLGTMLGESFREVHLLWSSPIDWGYVERAKPAIVLHQLAERFLRRVPVDGFDIEAFASRRLDAARRAEVPDGLSEVP